MDKAIQNCFDICPSSKGLGTGAVQSRADFNIRTEEVLHNNQELKRSLKESKFHTYF